MSFNNTYMMMSEEDKALFREIQQAALLPTLAQPGVGDLAQRQRAFRRQEAMEMLDPYADVLEQQIMPSLLEKREELLAKLTNSQNDGYFHLEICEWNIVQYSCKGAELREHIDSLSLEERGEFLNALTERNNELTARGWIDSVVSVKKINGEAEVMMLRPQRIERIMRKSNLGWRLAQVLGPNFRPEVIFQPISHVGAPRSKLDYIALKGILTLVYCPLGLKSAPLKKMLATAKRQRERRANDALWRPEADEVVSSGLRWYQEG
jgi:hypothetical protein